MTPKNENSWKRTVQGVCAIAVVMALSWIWRQGFPIRISSHDGVIESSEFAAAPDGASHLDYCESEVAYVAEKEERDYGDILGMPVCADLSDSIQTLRGVRNKLLQVAFDQDAQAVSAAAGEYHEAVQQVQAGLARLKTHLAPDDLPYVSQELLESIEPDHGQPLTPWELGRFAEDMWR